MSGLTFVHVYGAFVHRVDREQLARLVEVVARHLQHWLTAQWQLVGCGAVGLEHALCRQSAGGHQRQLQIERLAVVAVRVHVELAAVVAKVEVFEAQQILLGRAGRAVEQRKHRLFGAGTNAAREQLVNFAVDRQRVSAGRKKNRNQQNIIIARTEQCWQQTYSHTSMSMRWRSTNTRSADSRCSVKRVSC